MNIRRRLTVLGVAASVAVGITTLISAPARGAGSLEIMLSTSPNRANPRPLYGAGVAGSMYAFVPSSGETKVAFYLDNPAHTGTATHTETIAPFDLGGGTTAAADPFSVAGLANGTHTLTAVISISGGTTISTASFAVANPGVWPTKYTYKSAASQTYSISEAQSESIGGKVYQFGGFDTTKRCCTETSRSYIYDPATNVWTALAPMPGGGVTHAGSTTDGRSVYLAGGYIPNSSGQQIFGTKAVWKYDTVTGVWSSMPALPIIRAAGQLVWLDGKLHYFGGEDATRDMETADHYVLDVAGAATTWTTSTPLPFASNHLGGVALGGLIYAIGGQTGHDSAATVTNKVQIFDPTTNAWHFGANLPSARSHMADATFVEQGRIIVAGGSTTGVFNPVNEVDAYDPATNTWSTLTPLPGARMSMVAADIGNGQWFATGGEAKNSYRAVPSS